MEYHYDVNHFNDATYILILNFLHYYVKGKNKKTLVNEGVENDVFQCKEIVELNYIVMNLMLPIETSLSA